MTPLNPMPKRYVWLDTNKGQYPGDTKVQIGWQYAEKPSHNTFNWYQHLLSANMVHLLENGIAAWDSETEYQAGGYCTSNGETYRTSVDCRNKPVTDKIWGKVLVLTPDNYTNGTDGKPAANAILQLDSSGKIHSSFMTATGMNYQGSYDLAVAMPAKSVDGDNVAWTHGDYIIPKNPPAAGQTKKVHSSWPGIAGKDFKGSESYIYNAKKSPARWEQIGITSDKSYLPLDGTSPMTGSLMLKGAPTKLLEATTKKYVDGEVSKANAKFGDHYTKIETDAKFLPLDGHKPMTGTLTVNSKVVVNPTSGSDTYITLNHSNGKAGSYLLNYANGTGTLIRSFDKNGVKKTDLAVLNEKGRATLNGKYIATEQYVKDNYIKKNTDMGTSNLNWVKVFESKAGQTTFDLSTQDPGMYSILIKGETYNNKEWISSGSFSYVGASFPMYRTVIASHPLVGGSIVLIVDMGTDGVLKAFTIMGDDTMGTWSNPAKILKIARLEVGREASSWNPVPPPSTPGVTLPTPWKICSQGGCVKVHNVDQDTGTAQVTWKWESNVIYETSAIMVGGEFRTPSVIKIEAGAYAGQTFETDRTIGAYEGNIRRIK